MEGDSRENGVDDLLGFDSGRSDLAITGDLLGEIDFNFGQESSSDQLLDFTVESQETQKPSDTKSNNPFGDSDPFASNTFEEQDPFAQSKDPFESQSDPFETKDPFESNPFADFEQDTKVPEKEPQSFEPEEIEIAPVQYESDQEDLYECGYDEDLVQVDIGAEKKTPQIAEFDDISDLSSSSQGPSSEEQQKVAQQPVEQVSEPEPPRKYSLDLKNVDSEIPFVDLTPIDDNGKNKSFLESESEESTEESDEMANRMVEEPMQKVLKPGVHESKEIIQTPEGRKEIVTKTVTAEDGSQTITKTTTMLSEKLMEDPMMLMSQPMVQAAPQQQHQVVQEDFVQKAGVDEKVEMLDTPEGKMRVVTKTVTAADGSKTITKTSTLMTEQVVVQQQEPRQRQRQQQPTHQQPQQQQMQQQIQQQQMQPQQMQQQQLQQQQLQQQQLQQQKLQQQQMQQQQMQQQQIQQQQMQQQQLQQQQLQQQQQQQKQLQAQQQAEQLRLAKMQREQERQQQLQQEQMRQQQVASQQKQQQPTQLAQRPPQSEIQRMPQNEAKTHPVTHAMDQSAPEGYNELKGPQVFVANNQNNDGEEGEESELYEDKTKLKEYWATQASGARKESIGNAGENACATCGTRVYEMEKLVAEKQIFHKNCFKCSKCKRTLGVGNYATNEGKLLCKPHFMEIFRLRGHYNERWSRENTPERVSSDGVRPEDGEDGDGKIVRSEDKIEDDREGLPSLKNIKSRFENVDGGQQQAPKPAPGKLKYTWSADAARNKEVSPSPPRDPDIVREEKSREHVPIASGGIGSIKQQYMATVSKPAPSAGPPQPIQIPRQTANRTESSPSPARDPNVVRAEDVQDEGQFMPPPQTTRGLVARFKQLETEGQGQVGGPAPEQRLDLLEQERQIPDSGEFTNRPQVRDDVVTEWDEVPEQELPEVGAAKSRINMFRQKEKEVAQKPPPAFGDLYSPGGQMVNGDPNQKRMISSERPVNNQPDVIRHEESSTDQRPPQDMTKNMLSKFRQMEAEAKNKKEQEWISPRKQSLEKPKISAAPRWQPNENGTDDVDRPLFNPAKPEGGEFENSPQDLPDVVRESDPFDENELPEIGVTKNLLAKFKAMQT